MLIETHAHLDYPDFANDLDDVLRRANDAGVTRIITIGTSLESSRRAIDMAEKHSAVFAAIGVHPTSVEEAEDDVITPLRELAKNPRVVAIGETGLDYHQLPSEKVAKEKQVQVMTALRTETDEEVEAQVPLWKFMVETDCPYLAPVPFRGKRCEPAHTRIVAEAIAAARAVPFEEIAEATTETAGKFFRFNRR